MSINFNNNILNKTASLLRISNEDYKSKFIEDIKIKYQLDNKIKDIKKINDIIKLLIY